MVSLQSLRPILSLPGDLFGSTSLSFDSRTSERYIVQWISAQEIQHMEKSLSEQFNRYLYIAALNIPGTLPLLSSAQDAQQNTQLIFKYIEGMSLYESLSCRGRGFSLIEARNMLKDIVKVYHKFEKYGGLHHRNIKLENIYYGTSSKTFSLGGLEMADFCGSTMDSSSKAIWGRSHQSQICGNLDTLPPETLDQLLKLLSQPSSSNSSLTPVTRKADVFALALVCLQMIAPRIVFEQSATAGPKPLPTSRKESSNLSDFFSPNGIARFQQDRSRRIAEALEYVDREHGRDHPFMRQFDMTSFLQLLRQMLEPNPDKRCPFKYLYEFFDVREVQTVPRQIVEARMISELDNPQPQVQREERTPTSNPKVESAQNSIRIERLEMSEHRVQSSSKPTEFLQKKSEPTLINQQRQQSASPREQASSQMQEESRDNPQPEKASAGQREEPGREDQVAERTPGGLQPQDEAKVANSVPETTASTEQPEQPGSEQDRSAWSPHDPLSGKPTVVAEKIKILSDPNVASIPQARRCFFQWSNERFLLSQFSLITSHHLLNILDENKSTKIYPPEVCSQIAALAYATNLISASYIGYVVEMLENKSGFLGQNYFSQYLTDYRFYLDREYMKKIASLGDCQINVDLSKKRCKNSIIHFLKPNTKESSLVFGYFPSSSFMDNIKWADHVLESLLNPQSLTTGLLKHFHDNNKELVSLILSCMCLSRLLRFQGFDSTFQRTELHDLAVASHASILGQYVLLQLRQYRPDFKLKAKMAQIKFSLRHAPEHEREEATIEECKIAECP